MIFAVVVLVVALVGILVGAVGIGGVVLVPLLNLVLDVDVDVAIASCLFSYLFSGIVSVLLYRRYGSIEWRSAGLVGAGAMPGALFGAMAVDAIAPRGLLFGIAVLMLAGGIHGLAGSRRASRTLSDLPAPSLAALGFCVGIISAMTGTGGAVTLVPLLLAFGIPALPAIGLGQVMQIPVAVSGSFPNILAETVDFGLAAALAVGLSVGILAGVHFAHHLPTRFLHRTVASLLVIFGTGLIVKNWMG